MTDYSKLQEKFSSSRCTGRVKKARCVMERNKKTSSLILKLELVLINNEPI